MAKKKSTAPKAVARVGKLERNATWAGLRLGDAVEISGTGLRSARWEFVAHVRNVESGDEWVEVVGGRPGDRMIRSFRPERVYPPRPSKSTGGGSGSINKMGKQNTPSFADAPQLPLS